MEWYIQHIYSFIHIAYIIRLYLCNSLVIQFADFIYYKLKSRPAHPDKSLIKINYFFGEGAEYEDSRFLKFNITNKAWPEGRSYYISAQWRVQDMRINKELRPYRRNLK